MISEIERLKEEHRNFRRPFVYKEKEIVEWVREEDKKKRMELAKELNMKIESKIDHNGKLLI